MASEASSETVAARTPSTTGTVATSAAADAGTTDAAGEQPVPNASGGGSAADPKRAAAAKMAADAETSGPVRVDSWIWSVRLVKSRSMAADACRGGHVRVNGERVKPAYNVRSGDEVRLRQAGRERIVVVKRVIRKRVGAPVAALCYIDNSPPPPPREAVAPAGVRDRGAGRPTKRDRREMERLRSVGGPAGPGAPGRLGGTGGSGGSGRGR
ncbi:RNA-binding S4 domain-containing protein [Streptomyces odontomachi]|uniref:RNA-binding S4 domain-containing protein n=1 Tax=Streptomyces odontomachi TaxID=2944940 RepID=UPI00210D1337|nr:RNA-binding S4 domain-containing protein [Streptomyces sp. ODS25]